MQLNKSLCQKCHADFVITTGNDQYKWSDEDETWWNTPKHRLVYCLPLRQMKFVETDPPEACPYILEHLMVNENETQ